MDELFTQEIADQSQDAIKGYASKVSIAGQKVQRLVVVVVVGAAVAVAPCR